MITNTEHLFYVELFGFTARESVILASMFKLSEMRRRTYRHWHGEEGVQPDCILLDMQAPGAKKRLWEISALAQPMSVIQVDGASSVLHLLDGAPQSTRLGRPLRWAELLVTLDRACAERAGVVILNGAPQEESEPLPPEASELLNEIEIDQVDTWYDRSQPLVFRTDPALLVVDPDPRTASYIKAKLAGMSYRVDYAATGDQAFDLLELNRYNVVSVELNLPDMDGYDVFAFLKKRQDRRRIAAMVLTKRTCPLERVRATLMGCDLFLSKPINPERLIKALEKFLPDWRRETPDST